MPTYSPKFGIDGPIKVGTAGASATSGTALSYISGPSLSISRESEEIDMAVTGKVKVYVNGKVDITISFTMKNFQDSGTYPADISAILTAFAADSPIAVYVSDTSLGDIDGDFKVSKMDESRDNGKVISWSVELKPTFVGRELTWS